MLETEYAADKEMQYRETVLYPRIAHEGRLLQEYRMRQAQRRRAGLSLWLGRRLMRLGARLAGPIEPAITTPAATSAPPG